MKTELTKPTVFAYFSGDATALQKKMVETWLADVRNVELYFEWLEEWEKTHLQFQADTARAHQIISEKIIQIRDSPALVFEQPTPKSYRKKLLLWTAASLFVMGFASYLGRDFLMYRIYSTAYGELNTFTLDDGSLVVLNANSTLLVPRLGFGTSSRNVYLDGEAEFAVRHTVDHQYFKVHTVDKSLITVLGTEFVVYSRPKLTNVILSKGKVELSSITQDEPLTMVPGDRAIIESNGDIKIEKLSPTQLVEQAAWKEHRFVFDNTPLKEVADKVQEVFGIEVTIQDSALAIRTATGSFPAKNAGELLTSMSYMYDFEITKNADKILLIPNP